MQLLTAGRGDSRGAAGSGRRLVLDDQQERGTAPTGGARWLADRWVHYTEARARRCDMWRRTRHRDLWHRRLFFVMSAATCGWAMELDSVSYGFEM